VYHQPGCSPVRRGSGDRLKAAVSWVVEGHPARRRVKRRVNCTGKNKACVRLEKFPARSEKKEGSFFWGEEKTRGAALVRAMVAELQRGSAARPPEAEAFPPASRGGEIKNNHGERKKRIKIQEGTSKRKKASTRPGREEGEDILGKIGDHRKTKEMPGEWGGGEGEGSRETGRQKQKGPAEQKKEKGHPARKKKRLCVRAAPENTASFPPSRQRRWKGTGPCGC